MTETEITEEQQKAVAAHNRINMSFNQISHKINKHVSDMVDSEAYATSEECARKRKRLQSERTAFYDDPEVQKDQQLIKKVQRSTGKTIQAIKRQAYKNRDK